MINEAAKVFGEPPKRSFPIMAGGVPAVIGPWMFRITTDRQLVVLPMHQLEVLIEPYPAGSARLSCTWSYVNGNNETQLHAITHVLPRPENGTHLGKVLLYQAHWDPYADTRSRKGKQRRGVTYFLTVTHVYAPHEDRTVNGLWERHLAEAAAADTHLNKALQAINETRALLRKPPS